MTVKNGKSHLKKSIVSDLGHVLKKRSRYNKDIATINYKTNMVFAAAHGTESNIYKDLSGKLPLI